MFIFLMIIHVIVCLVLILAVLLQAGRGGGMSDMFGGGQPSSLFGTQTNVFLTRATEVCAVLFMVTSVGLGLLTTQKSKSLMDRVNLPVASIPAKASSETPKPLEVPKVPQAPETPALPTAVAEAVAPVTETVSSAASTTVSEVVNQASNTAQAVVDAGQKAAGAVSEAVKAPLTEANAS